jgi:hypothetical protein
MNTKWQGYGYLLNINKVAFEVTTTLQRIKTLIKLQSTCTIDTRTTATPVLNSVGRE